MLTSNRFARSTEDITRLGTDLLRNRIEPLLAPTENGKFVAIDVDSGEYEVDESDHTAVTRLLTRQPKAEIWLGRAGQTATYRIGQIK